MKLLARKYDNYRGLISCTNSDMVESLPTASESPAGMSKVAALLVTPLGHSLVIMNQGSEQSETDYTKPSTKLIYNVRKN